MQIYEPKLRKRVMFEECSGVNNGFELESRSFENAIDVGCFNPETWDIVLRSYVKKRLTL